MLNWGKTTNRHHFFWYIGVFFFFSGAKVLLAEGVAEKAINAAVLNAQEMNQQMAAAIEAKEKAEEFREQEAATTEPAEKQKLQDEAEKKNQEAIIRALQAKENKIAELEAKLLAQKAQEGEKGGGGGGGKSPPMMPPQQQSGNNDKGGGGGGNQAQPQQSQPAPSPVASAAASPAPSPSAPAVDLKPAATPRAAESGAKNNASKVASEIEAGNQKLLDLSRMSLGDAKKTAGAEPYVASSTAKRAAQKVGANSTRSTSGFGITDPNHVGQVASGGSGGSLWGGGSGTALRPLKKGQFSDSFAKGVTKPNSIYRTSAQSLLLNRAQEKVPSTFSAEKVAGAAGTRGFWGSVQGAPFVPRSLNRVLKGQQIARGSNARFRFRVPSVATFEPVLRENIPQSFLVRPERHQAIEVPIPASGSTHGGHISWGIIPLP